jgi:hypothetical protein
MTAWVIQASLVVSRQLLSVLSALAVSQWLLNGFSVAVFLPHNSQTSLNLNSGTDGMLDDVDSIVGLEYAKHDTYIEECPFVVWYGC